MRSDGRVTQFILESEGTLNLSVSLPALFGRCYLLCQVCALARIIWKLNDLSLLKWMATVLMGKARSYLRPDFVIILMRS